MFVKNAIRKLERAGWLVNDCPPFIYARRSDNEHVIELCRNGGDAAGKVATIRVRYERDRDDLQSDYCAGVFCDSLNQALHLARS